MLVRDEIPTKISRPKNKERHLNYPHKPLKHLTSNSGSISRRVNPSATTNKPIEIPVERQTRVGSRKEL